MLTSKHATKEPVNTTAGLGFHTAGRAVGGRDRTRTERGTLALSALAVEPPLLASTFISDSHIESGIEVAHLHTSRRAVGAEVFDAYNHAEAEGWTIVHPDRFIDFTPTHVVQRLERPCSS